MGSLKLQHEQLEEQARKRKSLFDFTPPATSTSKSVSFSDLFQKIESLEKKIDQINTQKVTVINTGNEQIRNNNIDHKEKISLFIPTPDLNDKKLSNEDKVETRKRTINISSAIKQLKALDNENNK